MFRIVEFSSEGEILRGRLYAPANLSKPLPIVIMAHGFSATITGMVADHFAEAFYDAGFAVLLYDHRNFGISGGEPRQQINKWVQTRGYRDAIDFVTTLPKIDAARIALWGDSLSGAEVLLVGAINRIKPINYRRINLARRLYRLMESRIENSIRIGFSPQGEIS